MRHGHEGVITKAEWIEIYFVFGLCQDVYALDEKPDEKKEFEI